MKTNEPLAGPKHPVKHGPRTRLTCLTHGVIGGLLNTSVGSKQTQQGNQVGPELIGSQISSVE